MTHITGSAKYLGFAMIDECVQLRTGERFISDIHEIANYIRLVIRPERIEFIADSNVNLSWYTTIDGIPRILTLGPKLIGQADLDPMTSRESGFLDPDKFDRIKKICAQVSGQSDIPCPRVHHAEFVPRLNRALAIQDMAGGVNLAKLIAGKPMAPRGEQIRSLGREQKMIAMRNTGRLLVDLHTIPQMDDQDSHYPPRQLTREMWYMTRATLALRWLANAWIFEPKEVDAIMNVVVTLLDETTGPAPCLIHGDLIAHNIFVDPTDPELTIRNVIDWETACEAGDPHHDTILTAWWMAGEGNEDEGPKVFSTIISEYNDHCPTELKIDNQQLDKLLMLADLTWHLNVLPFTCLCETNRRNLRVQSVRRILDAFHENERYLPKDWKI